MNKMECRARDFDEAIRFWDKLSEHSDGAVRIDELLNLQELSFVFWSKSFFQILFYSSI